MMQLLHYVLWAFSQELISLAACSFFTLSVNFIWNDVLSFSGMLTTVFWAVLINFFCGFCCFFLGFYLTGRGLCNPIICTYGAFDCKMVMFSTMFGCPLNLLRMDSSYGFALMFWDRFFWGAVAWFISELATFTSLSLFRCTLSWVLWFWWIFNLQLSVPDPLQVL